MKQWLNTFDRVHFYKVLMPLVESQLSSLPIALEEYALIQQLEKTGVFAGLSHFPANLALFAKHFLTRHGVYYLLPDWQAKNIGVDFELMRLRFYVVDTTANKNQRAIAQYQATQLADFYGDLSILEAATESSVNALLVDFWQRFSAYQQVDSLLAILGLPADAKWPAMQLAYRRLAAQHHPDKGGDAERFINIQQAYEALRAVHAPQ